jgi:hypothetical protein
MTIVKKTSEGVKKSSTISMAEKGRETKAVKNCKEVVVREAVVSFLLVEEEQGTVCGRGCGVWENRSNELSDIGGLSALNEPSLIGRNQGGEDTSETSG